MRVHRKILLPTKPKLLPLLPPKPEGAGLTVKTARGDAKVPQNPERIAVYDLGMLDTLNKLGVKTGLSIDKNRLPYLDEYFKTTKPAGTLFEPDYEALNAYNRSSSSSAAVQPKRLIS